MAAQLELPRYLTVTDDGRIAVKREPFYVRTGSMFENPFGVPREEIIQMILDDPSGEVVAQTVFGKYVENSGVVFSGLIVNQMFDRTIPVVRGQTYLARSSIAPELQSARDEAAIHILKWKGWWGDRYLTGVDLARKTDYTVITVLDTLTMPARLVYWKRVNRVPWATIYAEIGRAISWFGPNVLLDGSGPQGDVILDALEGKNYCKVHHLAIDKEAVCMKDGLPLPGCKPERDYVSLGVCEPYIFTAQSKYELLDHLRLVLGASYDPRNPGQPFGHLRAPVIPQLQEELTFYTWDDKKLETDCVMSLGLAAWEMGDPGGLVDVGSPWGS